LGPEIAAELLRQIRDGKDIPAPASLLRNIKAEAAAEHPVDSPYSILANLAHAHFWQRLWLDRLAGGRARSFTEDWQTPDPACWSDLRRDFLTGLDEAIRVASADPFEHKMKSDEIAVKTLIQIGIHDAYHLGQINLLKRQARLRDSRRRSEPKNSR
jgi:hypothetical protein